MNSSGGDAADKLSPSGIPIKTAYGPNDTPIDYTTDLNDPGRWPFTRGVQASMYRGRLWTMRQYAGFGTARDTNERFKLLLAAGQTGLSVAFDLPTQMGLDSDSPRSLGEVGRAGVAIDSVEDMHQLLADLRSVRLRGVDEIDAKLDGAAEHRQRLRLVLRRAEDAVAGDPHRAESEPAHRKVAAEVESVG